jgi:hypothetical protein
MPESFAEKTEDKLTCESCGKEFACGANLGKCWCFEIDLDTEILAEFKEKFQNCLCQDCLLSRELQK